MEKKDEDEYTYPWWDCITFYGNSNLVIASDPSVFGHSVLYAEEEWNIEQN